MPHDECKTPEDARLVDYVREHQRLHPKIMTERRISRTDIFEVLFGHNEAAKQVAGVWDMDSFVVQCLDGDADTGEADLLGQVHDLHHLAVTGLAICLNSSL